LWQMPSSASEPESLPVRWIRAFGEFWLDFFVGDSPELLIGVLIVIGAAALVVHQHAPRFVVIGSLPVLAAIILSLSVVRRSRRR